MTDPEHHDWPKIIREIKRGYRQRHGKKLTNYKLGMMLAATDPRTVERWLKGAEPGHYKGNLLLEYQKEFHSGNS